MFCSYIYRELATEENLPVYWTISPDMEYGEYEKKQFYTR